MPLAALPVDLLAVLVVLDVLLPLAHHDLQEPRQRERGSDRIG
jgi:hypothetical protein